MKKEELRIGNFVRDVHSTDKGYWQVVSLTEKICKFGVYRIKYEQLIPIPLTEEWLMRLGFEKSDALGKETQRVCVKDNFHVIIDFQETWGWCYAINSVQVVSIKSVHHLQNLFHALTGIELVVIQEPKVQMGGTNF